MKKIGIVFITFILLLTSCAKSEFKADEYVYGMLTNVFKGEVTDTYAEIVQMDKAELLQDHVDFMDVEVDFFAKYFEMVLTLKTQFSVNGLVKQLYANSKFEVGKPIKDNDTGYRVDVTVYPIDTILKLADNEWETFKVQFEKDIESGVYDALENDEAREDYFTNQIVALFDKYRDNITYADPKVYTVKVLLGEDNLYYVDETDISSILNNILLY